MVRGQALKKPRDDNKDILGAQVKPENIKNLPLPHTIQRDLPCPKGEFFNGLD